MRTGIFTFIFLLFSTCLFANIVTAVTNTATPGDWGDGASWSSGTVPQSGDVVLVPLGKAISVSSQVYSVIAPTLIIQVTGSLNFHPSGRLDLSALSSLQLFVGGKIIPQNSASSQLVTLGGVTKYNAANNGTVTGPAFADVLSGASTSGQPLSGFLLGVLPVKFAGFSAKLQSDGVALQWQTASEEGLRDFTVERSDDGGTNWLSRGVIAAKGAAGFYNFVDRLTVKETALFRIKATDKDQRYSYSSILKVSNKSNISLAITPNPATDHVQVSLANPPGGTLVIRFIDISGRVVRTTERDGSQNSFGLSVAGLQKGNYVLTLSNSDQIIGKQLIVVQ